jgi:hypothetical protein
LIDVQYKLEKKGGSLFGKQVYSPIIIGDKKITPVTFFGESAETVYLVEKVAGKPIILTKKESVVANKKVSDNSFENFEGGVGVILEKPEVNTKTESESSFASQKSESSVEFEQKASVESPKVEEAGKVKVINPTKTFMSGGRFKNLSNVRGRFNSFNVASSSSSAGASSVGVKPAISGVVGSKVIQASKAGLSSGQVIGQSQFQGQAQSQSQSVGVSNSVSTSQIVKTFNVKNLREASSRSVKAFVPPGLMLKNGVGSGFNVEVRRRGKFEVVASNVPLSRAFSIGKKEIGNSAAASYRVVPLSGKANSELNANIGRGLGKGLYFSKRESGVIIETPSIRIKSAGEKYEIPGAAARKKRGRIGLL